MTKRAFDTRRRCAAHLFRCPETRHSYVLEPHNAGGTLCLYDLTLWFTFRCRVMGDSVSAGALPLFRLILDAPWMREFSVGDHATPVGVRSSTNARARANTGTRHASS